MDQSVDQLTSICSPLSSGVPQSIKSKIVNGDYIDLALLFDNPINRVAEPSGADMKLSVDELGNVVWKPNKPKCQIISINQWTSAFLVFSSVYLEAHPHRTQELLKYTHIVRTASSRFGGGVLTIFNFV